MKTYFRLAAKTEQLLIVMLRLVPVLDILLPNGSRETTPGKRREWKDQKISTRRAIFLGKTFFSCQSRPI